MNYGSLGKRFLAAIIDYVAISAIGLFIILITDEWYFGLSALFISAVYYILFEGGSWHATPGKKIMKISVVDEFGTGIDYSKATIRFLGRILSSLIFGIGYIIALFDDKRQALHDRLAGTYVVEGDAESAGATGHSVIGVSGELAGMRFAISGNGLMMGRDPAVCQIVLQRSKGISRLHCFVSYNPSSNMFILTDRNSKYGTFTGDGERITPQKSIALKSGQHFYLGSKDNMFELM